VARLGPDIVAAQSSHAHSLCVLAGLRPVVHRRVDFAVGRSPQGRWKYGRACLYVAVSRGVGRVLEAGGVAPGSIRVVHDGVRPLAALPPARDLQGEGPLVGAVGALVNHKAHQVLVEAMALLPGVRCVIAGEGHRRSRLEAQIRRLGLGDRVGLLGQRQDVAAVLAAVDLLVHPSVEEGMGQAVVEAMAAGRPVLVSDAGGLPEVVGDLCTPVPAGDAVALAAAIRARLDSPGDPQRFVQRARDHFSVDTMVEGTLAAYREAAAGGSPAGGSEA
jgi:glycosyltransferase involved in cell wall biosynthesis